MYCDPNTSEMCQPIRMIEAILEWEPPRQPNWSTRVIKRTERCKYCFKGLKQCKFDLTPNVRLSNSEVPKTMYCHDMAGGYLNDKYAWGNDKSGGFEFFRWSCIDIFVYFSHNLLTIPPLGWINAAHKNGVKVLGTLITEGTKGAAIWNKLLTSENAVAKMANSLAKICEFYNFEGYLINVENSIPSNKINLFCDFLSNLRTLLKQNDLENIIIWYDSVIYPFGFICYQNALNDLNKIFFDLSDGIFLNYTWSDKDLETSALKAGQRKLDVFVGVDIFGRGCKGGGGFGTVEAVDSVRKKGLSVALFAPGWVYECCLPGEQFLTRDYLFWECLCDHLYVSGPSYLPFKTNFSLGRGKRLFTSGQMVKDDPWYDLSRQDYQISGLIGSCGTIDSCLSYFEGDGINGGGCLLVKLSPLDMESPLHVDRLFACDFFTGTYGKLTFSITMKALELLTNPALDIVLSVEQNSMDRCVNLKHTGPSDLSKWTTFNYILDAPNSRVFEIGCMLCGDKSPLLIGEIHISCNI